MNRRNMLYGGAAAVAAVAGAGVAWWKIRPHDVVMPAASAGPADPFWNLSFDTPDGQPLAMNSFRGKPLLVNFWGTWCPPCIEELPLLDSFYKANTAKGWQVLGLAVDQPSAVRKWLQAKPLAFAVAMAGLDGTQLSKSMGNSSGSMPFTVVFDAAGQLRHRKTGKVTPEELNFWVAS
ncbi:MAG: TlpA disulfide reductase family protein [Pseudomonadota bacterium]